MPTFSTETIDNTEALAIAITRDQYATGHFDHDELERRISTIIGLDGDQERRRVLTTADIVDATSFGGHSMAFATGWSWPEEAAA